MRTAILLAIVLSAAGCGNDSGPVQPTAELEALQREQEKSVHEAETQWQQNRTTGDQEVEARQREIDKRVHDAEVEMQRQVRAQTGTTKK